MRKTMIFLASLLIACGPGNKSQENDNVSSENITAEESEQTAKNTLFYWNINGKVKTLERHQFDFTVEDGEIIKGEPSGSIGSHIMAVFGEDGNYEEFTNYSSDGTISAKEDFKRNDKGYLIEWSKNWPVDSLNEKGELAYDDAGNRVELKLFDNDGGLKERYVRKFNDEGKIVENTKFNSDGEMEWRQEVNWDTNGFWVGMKRYNPEGELILKQFDLINDNFGNWVEGKQMSVKDSVTNVYSATYSYDGADNWIQMAVYKDGEPMQLNERKITYFE